MKQYENLRKKYPQYVSLDQLRVICKVAKRTATYLVVNNIIPAIDTGRKTWRYLIAIDDVIIYLQRRDKEGSLVPIGATNPKNTSALKSYSQVVMRGEEQKVVKYFSDIYTNYPDVLTVADMASMTGLSKKTFFRILKDGRIKTLDSNTIYIIPKVYFWEFIKSRRFIDIRSHSKDFIRILEGFEAWRGKQ